MSDIRISAKGLQLLLATERKRIAEQVMDAACDTPECPCCLRAYETVIAP